VTSPADKKARILLVDDEFVILETLKLLLMSQGYDPVPVRDSDKARDIIGVEHFDLVITDLRMNPIDGMEILRTAHARCPDMPSIMLTAFGAQDVMDEARENGAVAFLSKPFKPDQVFAAVAKALGGE
jgi:DNA-binding NtrC family response regulator